MFSDGGINILSEPSGGRLTSEGQSLENNKNKIPEKEIPSIGGNRAYLQSTCVVIHAINGTNKRVPAAYAAVKTPTTNPLFLLNHRVATVAAKPSPIIPDATPRQIPILTNKCHFSNAKTVRNKLNKSKVMANFYKAKIFILIIIFS